MPFFKLTLIGIGSICDAECTFVFKKQSVVVYDPQQRPIITGWRETHDAKIWRIDLLPSPLNISTPPTVTKIMSLQAFSAYDPPSVEALVQYFHAAEGFLVRDTWIRDIKCGNYSSWTRLTYTNTVRYCPSSDKIIMGHLVQYKQGVISTKSKIYMIQTTITPNVVPPSKPHQELHIHIKQIIKLYMDYTGRLPIS